MTTSRQRTIFDVEKGEQERDEGIARVGSNADTFVQDMREVAVAISREKGYVTSDDLRRIAADEGLEPHHPNAWGAIFRGKRWECIGRRKSAKVSNHAREIRVWRWIDNPSEGR